MERSRDGEEGHAAEPVGRDVEVCGNGDRIGGAVAVILGYLSQAAAQGNALSTVF